MAEIRIRTNGVGGTIDNTTAITGGVGLAAAGTAFSSAALAAAPAVSAGQHWPIVLDPDGEEGVPEIAWVTGHTVGATTATIARGEETWAGGIAARDHYRDINWVHAMTMVDYPGSPGGMGRVGYNAYNPVSVTGVTTSSATFSDVDATNMKVTFLAPPTGKVLVRLSALALVQTSTEYLDWNIRDASGDVTGLAARVLGGAGGLQLHQTVEMEKSGLTPGQSYTWKWGHARPAGTGTNVATTYMGGVANASIMEIEAMNF